MSDSDCSGLLSLHICSHFQTAIQENVFRMRTEHYFRKGVVNVGVPKSKREQDGAAKLSLREIQHSDVPVLNRAFINVSNNPTK